MNDRRMLAPRVIPNNFYFLRCHVLWQIIQPKYKLFPQSFPLHTDNHSLLYFYSEIRAPTKILGPFNSTEMKELKLFKKPLRIVCLERK